MNLWTRPSINFDQFVYKFYDNESQKVDDLLLNSLLENNCHCRSSAKLSTLHHQTTKNDNEAKQAIGKKNKILVSYCALTLDFGQDSYSICHGLSMRLGRFIWSEPYVFWGRLNGKIMCEFSNFSAWTKWMCQNVFQLIWRGTIKVQEILGSCHHLAK